MEIQAAKNATKEKEA
jgi:hypothetical protein